MESKNRHILGRSIVLERQKRFSIETSERIYIENTQLKGHDPLVSRTNKVDLSRTSISSGIERIHRTRQRVDSLNDRINYEIDRLKEVVKHFKNRKSRPEKIQMASNKQMTWGESFSANRGKVTQLAADSQHGSGRGRRSCSCPVPRCKPFCQLVDIKSSSQDRSPKPALKELYKRKPPPKGFPTKRFPSKELPPKGLPSKELPPKRLASIELPPKERLPKELPPNRFPPNRFPPKELSSKEFPPIRFPPRRLPLKELPSKRLSSKELPPNRFPSRDLPPKERPPKDLPPNRFPPKDLPPKRLPSRELPPKELPPKRHPSKELPLNRFPPKELSSKEFPPIRFPPRRLPSKELPPKRLSSKEIPPKELSSKEFPPIRFPPRRLPSKELPPKRLSSKELPPNRFPSRELPPKERPPKDLPPNRFPPKDLPPKRLPSRELPPKELPPKRHPSKELPLNRFPPKELSSKEFPPIRFPPRRLPSKDLPPNRFPPKEPPPKERPPKELPPKERPPKDLPPKERPPKDLPPKERPPKDLATRKPPPKNSTKKELKPGKPPPKELSSQKPLFKELLARKPLPKEEAMQKDHALGELTPEERTSGELPTRRVSGGCCQCYCNCTSSCCSAYQDNYGTMNQSSYCAGAQVNGYPNCRLIQGMQYGIPYCLSARRQVTDLNTEETCRNRNSTPKEMSSQQCSSKQTVSSSLYRSKSRENRSPARYGRTPENENTRRKMKEKVNTTYKMRGQEKLLKVESPDKIVRGQGREKLQRDQGREKLQRDQGREELERDQGREKLHRVQGQEKLQRVQGQEKLQRDQGGEKLQRDQGQEKLQGVQGQEKLQRVQYLGNLLKEESQEKIMMVPLKKEFQSPGDFTRDKPRVRAQKPEVTEFVSSKLARNNVVPSQSPKKEQECGVNERMYQDYLNMYYQENSKEDIREGKTLKTAPTYTRLAVKKEKNFTEDVRPKTRTEKPENPLTHTDRNKGQALYKTNIKEEQRVPRSKDSQRAREVVRPQVSDEAFTRDDALKGAYSGRKNQEFTEYETPSSSPQSDPSLFSYKTCCCERGNRSRDDNRKDCVGTRKTDPRGDRSTLPHLTRPIDFHDDSYLNPTGSRAHSPHSKSTRCEDKDRQVVRQERIESTKERVVVHEVPKIVNRERSPSPKKSKSPQIMESTSYAPMPGRHQRSRDPSPKRQVMNTQRVERSIPSFEKSTQVYQDFYRPQRNLSPESFGAGSSRNQAFSLASRVTAPCPSTDSSSETIVINPHYQTKDSQSPRINRDTLSDTNSSDEGSEEELEEDHFDMKPPDVELLDAQFKKDYKEALRGLPEKTERSRSASPQRIFQQPISNEFRNESSEKSDFQTWACEEEPEEALPRKPEKTKTLRNDSPLAQSQSKHKSNRRIVDQEDMKYSRLPNTKDCECPTDDCQSRSEYDGYESARSYDPNKVYNLQMNRSFSPQKGGDDTMPIVETVCEKRTRTVTFEDELGDLEEQQKVEEHCRSRIDWERALKYRLTDQASDQYFTDDTYTSRSSSSAEHTCIESSCEDGDAYESCAEKVSRTDQGMPPFEACPCMYETYRDLTALCRNKSPF